MARENGVKKKKESPQLKKTILLVYLCYTQGFIYTLRTSQGHRLGVCLQTGQSDTVLTLEGNNKPRLDKPTDPVLHHTPEP